MSYSLKYYPDPGIAFDISKMLFVKLNPESVWKDYMTTLDSNIDEAEFIRQHAKSFPAPDPDLLLFSFRPANKTETFISQIISTYISQNFIEFSIDCLINYLCDISTVQKDLYMYYFGNEDFSVTNLEIIIRTNKLIPDKIKLLLFSFLLNPTKYISSLSVFIQKYYEHIKATYFPDTARINLPASFIQGIVNNTYSPEDHVDARFLSKTLSYSLCFTIPDYLLRNFTKPNPYLITTPLTIDNTFTTDDPPYTHALLTCTTALNDKYRIAIIEQLILNKNMTLQEISQAIGLSTSTTNHHLSRLKRSNMITCVRHSHAMYYSFNPVGFQDLINLIQKIWKGAKEL